MIPFDFDYYKPETLEEAYSCMADFIEKNVKAYYYAGGTELIASFRSGKLTADAIIDLKTIKAMSHIREEVLSWVIGANVSLNQVIDHEAFAFMAPVLRPIADHTIRNAIRLGGNLCGRLPYKEAILPLLAIDAQLTIMGREGLKTVGLRSLFHKKIDLERGEILVAVHIPKHITHVLRSDRVTAHSDVAYPLLHGVMASNDHEVVCALSGFGGAPLFHTMTKEAHDALEDPARGWFEVFKPLAKSDQQGSADYRRMHLLKFLKEGLGGGPHD